MDASHSMKALKSVAFVMILQYALCSNKKQKKKIKKYEDVFTPASMHI